VGKTEKTTQGKTKRVRLVGYWLPTLSWNPANLVSKEKERSMAAPTTFSVCSGFVRFGMVYTGIIVLYRYADLRHNWSQGAPTTRPTTTRWRNILVSSEVSKFIFCNE